VRTRILAHSFLGVSDTPEIPHDYVMTLVLDTEPRLYFRFFKRKFWGYDTSEGAVAEALQGLATTYRFTAKSEGLRHAPLTHFYTAMFSNARLP